MKWKNLLENWGLTSVKLNMKFAEMEFSPNQNDEKAAWEMYVELVTRISTQKLPDEVGDEQTALTSIYSLFNVTRNILKKYGRNSNEFTKLSIIILNQVIRPFTAKWHKLTLENALLKPEMRKEFRNELSHLQVQLRKYTKMLAEIAKVEDLTEFAIED